MSQNPSTPSVPLELVPHGQLAERTQAALLKMGKKVSTSDLINAYTLILTAQENFTATAIRFGIALLAKKEVTPHGEFQNVLIDIREKVPHWKRVSDLKDRDNACREMRSYMCLARKFLASVESLDGRTAWASALRVQLPENVPAGLVLAEHLLTISGAEFDRAIGGFVQGRSLRRLIADLREALADAEADENADAELAKRKGRKPSPDERLAAQRKEAEQLYFQDLLPRVRENFLGENPAFELLNRAERQQLADALATAAKRVRASL